MWAVMDQALMLELKNISQSFSTTENKCSVCLKSEICKAIFILLYYLIKAILPKAEDQRSIL